MAARGWLALAQYNLSCQRPPISIHAIASGPMVTLLVCAGLAYLLDWRVDGARSRLPTQIARSFFNDEE